MSVRFLFTIVAACAALALYEGCNKSKSDAGPQSGGDSTSARFDSTAVPAVVTDSTPISLRFRFRKGQVQHFYVVLHSSSDGSFNERPASGTEDSRYNFTIRSEGVQSDSTLRAIVTFDTIHVAIRNIQVDKSFSSTDTAQMHDPQYALYSRLLNIGIPITVSKTGEITTVDSVSSIVDRILEMHPDKREIPPNAREMLTAQVTDAGVKTIVQHAFPHFPDQPVTKHGTWELKFNSVADAFPTQNIVTYELANISTSGPVRTGTVTSKLGVNLLQKRLEDSTATLQMKKSSFNAVASAEVDLDNGMVSHKESHMTVEMEYLMSGKGNYKGNSGKIKKVMKFETLLERH